MNLIAELKAKSANADSVKREVIEEIKAYFDEYLNGDGLENYLRKRIGTSEIRDRKVYMDVEFWEYHSGCGKTRFSCGGEHWYNSESRDGWNSHNYKGVELRTIDKEVGAYLSAKLEKRMSELGFTLVSKEVDHNRFNYYDIHYYFGW